MLDITETDNISQSPFCFQPINRDRLYNIQNFTFNSCFAIKGGLATKLLFIKLESVTFLPE